MNNAIFAASPAHFADLRGARNLTQAQIGRLIGDEATLLPEGLQVWNCWAEPPDGFDALVARAINASITAEQIRALWLCPPGVEPQKTGTPLPLDALRPEGHPLGQD